MKNIFDFSDMEQSEKLTKKTWEEFRQDLAKEIFFYDEIDKAKGSTFLKVYDDLFHQHSGIEKKTLTVGEICNKMIGRGAILKADETPDFERFMPKGEYIKEDNRFSPSGIEWLYLAIGDEDAIYECAKAECRAKAGDRFGFCHFDINLSYEDCKIVDLTIADDLTYSDINKRLEDYVQFQIKKAINIEKAGGYVPKMKSDKKEFEEVFKEWSVYTYTKLLSEQIFLPLNASDNKKILYAPFQTMAQYYISMGYAGIIFSSTVCPVGKNIVLFDKKIAKPTGTIEIVDIK